MKEFTLDEFQKKRKEIPDSVKDILFSEESGRVLIDITNKLGLHIDKAGILGDETAYLAFGMITPEEFLIRIEQKLEITEPVAQEIAKEIDEKTLKRVRIAYAEAKNQPTIPSGNSQPAVVTENKQIDPYREQIE